MKTTGSYSFALLMFYISPESLVTMMTFVYSEDFGDSLVEDEGDRLRSRITTCATQLDGMYDDPSTGSQKFNPPRYGCHNGFQKHPQIRPRDEPFVEVSPRFRFISDSSEHDAHS